MVNKKWKVLAAAVFASIAVTTSTKLNQKQIEKLGEAQAQMIESVQAVDAAKGKRILQLLKKAKEDVDHHRGKKAQARVQEYAKEVDKLAKEAVNENKPYAPLTVKARNQMKSLQEKSGKMGVKRLLPWNWFR